MTADFEQKIIELVSQGIVTSKQSESVILGSVQNNVKDVQADVKGVHQRLDVLNGRIPKIEDRLKTTERWIFGVTMATSTATVLIGIIVAMGVYIFNDLKSDLQNLSTILIQQLQK